MKDAPNRLPARLSEIRTEIEACVHCGFCLPTCPTYAELGTEMDSPRGRIYLIRALQEARIAPTRDVLRHLDRCLNCRACETACPSGVEYGHILEHTRGALEPVRRRSLRSRLLRWLTLEQLLPHRKRLSRARRVLGLYQGSPTVAWMRRRGWWRALPASWRRMEALAPQIAGLPLTEKLAVRFEPMGRPRGTVGLFTGCVMDQTMGNTHRATVRLLTRHGYSVQVIPDQTCCGALHVHNGAPDTARTLLLQNARAFTSAGVERIVVNSAGCGAQLREAPALFRGEDRSVVQKMASSSVDFTSFLVEIGFQPPSSDPTTGRVRRRVVYDAPCHLHHAQKVQEAPLELLGALPGVEVLPLDESDMCCGAAGIYNLLQPTLSARLLDRKLDRILASGADIVLTANPGCLIQIDAGLRARGSTIEVLHLADFLDAAYAPRDSSSDRPAWSGKRPISPRDPPR